MITDCSSLILEKKHYNDFVEFTNENLVKSFEYLFLSAQFGTFSKDRPGFEKILHGLSDAAWGKGIDMIKESAKRGVVHNFKDFTPKSASANIDDLSEVQAFAKAAEIEKSLLEKAIKVHRRHSHASTSDDLGKEHGYDAGISHFVEEEIIEGKTQTVRNLVGHVNDLKNLFKNGKDNFPLSLYLFDQYLQK
jgi:ferritin heavy chain